MRMLHIVQGGISNGDKEFIDGTLAGDRRADSWIVPKNSKPDDDVVFHFPGYGFYASAKIDSETWQSTDWKNRYSASLRSIRKIFPAINLDSVLEEIPELTWARYPRPITTPEKAIADKIRKLIKQRRSNPILNLSEVDISAANIHELRQLALLKSRKSLPVKSSIALYRVRSSAINAYALSRAEGVCEGCNNPGPFLDAKGNRYLECHHIMRVADDGPDHPANVIALCPNCHRRAHHAVDSVLFNQKMKSRVESLEAKRFPGNQTST